MVMDVTALKPDAIGYIFWPRSKRYVMPEQVAGWRALAQPGILKVGVFVDETLEHIAAAADAAGLDVVQLHGDETPDIPIRLRKMRPDLRIWKVVHLDRAENPTANAVDAFLVDSYSQTSPGGTGQTCDWDKARAFVSAVQKPVILAGGLHPGNVQEALHQVAPWGVDVSSGVEAAPGMKDLKLVKEFIEKCRNL